MVGAIAGSTKREPITVGKPAEFMLDNIAKTFGLQRHQICMVGDRLDTDILFGKNGGLTTCLVLSGEGYRLLERLELSRKGTLLHAWLRVVDSCPLSLFKHYYECLLLLCYVSDRERWRQHRLLCCRYGFFNSS